ncbi:zinc-binding dehydrogenase [Sneathiella sp. P13V-1]|uniref:NADPH:quinone oxidoreductase family protein n=1 Tax=Sneathiella sp. P13V-1 TaxID=2697366 RepID=UPI00187B5EED|nr:NADPH:quinone oxidoreductase family protein [Sneathiella sp. P13V-1]MBE7635973.1 zinc-binding dehydrogenase [Sneathiella sp. P13V-1]
MRAIVVHEFGHYLTAANLENLPIPTPGPGDVVVKQKACGVSFATSLTIAGKYQRKPPRPFSPVTESSGIVHAVGEGVTRVKVGDRVMCNVDSGGLSGFNLMDQVCCHVMPGGMSFAEGTAMVLSYTTSYGALIRRAKLKAGEWLVVHGAAGAVGVAAVEIGKAIGAKVIAVAGGPAHCKTAKEHGADYVIDHREEDFREKVLEITDGYGADVIYDSIGGEVMASSLRTLAWEGRILTIGYASGTIPDIPANRLLLKNASVMGFNLGHFFGWSPGCHRHDFVEELDEMVAGVFDLYRKGYLKPTIGASYPLHEFKEAMTAVLDRKVDGKCVVEFEEIDYQPL